VISHDLRNPLTALLTSSAKLNEDPAGLNPGQIKQLSQIIHRTSNKILEQLNEVVAWAKNQREKISFNPQKILLLQGIEESLELLMPSAQQKKIRLKNNIPGELYVNVDSLMLRSIVQNLVTNAIKFTPDGGHVIVSAQLLDGMVGIIIEDSGMGMPPEVQNNLFNRSATLSVSGTNNEQGTGLGLLLVYDFVTQHGGTIEVESEIGKGTTFKFTVPHVDTVILADS
jgi:signal transduction histidine kinase